MNVPRLFGILGSLFLFLLYKIDYKESESTEPRHSLVVKFKISRYSDFSSIKDRDDPRSPGR